MIKINKGTPPAYLSSAPVSSAILTLHATYDRAPTLFQTKSLEIGSHYSNDAVKNALIALQYGKCCFCEAKITHISYGDVEHFRPKKGYQQDDQDELHYPGYYWLAFDWDNLFLACQLCNQREKKNFFPLLNPISRAKCHHDNVLDEQPMFVHPSIDEPKDFITFIGEVPSAINGNERGKRTIDQLNLGRNELNENRLDYLELIRDSERWFLNWRADARQ